VSAFAAGRSPGSCDRAAATKSQSSALCCERSSVGGSLSLRSHTGSGNTSCQAERKHTPSGVQTVCSNSRHQRENLKETARRWQHMLMLGTLPYNQPHRPYVRCVRVHGPAAQQCTVAILARVRTLGERVIRMIATGQKQPSCSTCHFRGRNVTRQLLGQDSPSALRRHVARCANLRICLSHGVFKHLSHTEICNLDLA